MANSAVISVREPGLCGTYVARAQGLRQRASSTGGAEHAARACARKLYGEQGFSLVRYGQSNTWVATRQEEVRHG